MLKVFQSSLEFLDPDPWTLVNLQVTSRRGLASFEHSTSSMFPPSTYGHHKPLSGDQENFYQLEVLQADLLQNFHWRFILYYIPKNYSRDTKTKQFKAGWVRWEMVLFFMTNVSTAISVEVAVKWCAHTRIGFYPVIKCLTDPELWIPPVAPVVVYQKPCPCLTDIGQKIKHLLCRWIKITINKNTNRETLVFELRFLKGLQCVWKYPFK